MRAPIWRLVGILLVLGGESGFADDAKPDLAAAKNQLVADLTFLTSEQLRGRSSVEPTIQEAAEYLAARMKSIGLKTDLFDGEPYQYFKISVGPELGDPNANRLTVSVDGLDEQNEAAAPLDFQPVDFQPGDEFSPLSIGLFDAEVEGELAWVGYGISSDEHQYDDYAGMNVEGKLLLLLRKEPRQNDPESPFDGTKNTRHAFFETKIRRAIRAGAAGVLLVNDPDSVETAAKQIENKRKAEEERLSRLLEQIAALPESATNIRKKLNDKQTQIQNSLESLDDELRVARKGVLGLAEAGVNPIKSEGKPSRSIPVATISRTLADRLLRPTLKTLPKVDPLAGGGLSELESWMDTELRPRSFVLANARGKLKIKLKPNDFSSPNVVGTWPGRGQLAEQSIVIGAHYDHVGMGGRGSLAPGTVAVHNGADDNASGTAVLLQTASQLIDRLRNQPSHRRIIFIAFTGEERGLLGSRHYVAQPRFPLSNTVAMVNMDMVGRLKDNELTVYGTGTASGFEPLLTRVNQRAGFQLLRVKSGYGPSDHASFYQAGVPVLFFFTGLHADYHRPSDDFHRLNLDGMLRITDTVCQVSEHLATAPERPAYAETEKNVQIRRQLTVFMGVTLSQQPGEVVFSSIAPDSPAEAGGLKIGDRLVSVGKQPVQRIDQLMNELRKRSPGDNLSVTVIRGGETQQFSVQLRAR